MSIVNTLLKNNQICAVNILSKIINYSLIKFINIFYFSFSSPKLGKMNKTLLKEIYCHIVPVTRPSPPNILSTTPGNFFLRDRLVIDRYNITIHFFKQGLCSVYL
jgi:hypothetical protein